MKFILVGALAVALASSAQAQAPATSRALAGERLAQEKQCMQCHAVDRHTIGPSFETIRETYKRMKSPEARMIEVIRLGSAANLGPHWGRARMPDDSERPPVSQREARQLARWILSRPPSPAS